MTKLASGYWHIFDPQNGYTAIRGEALRELDTEKISRTYFFENDMLVQLGIQGCRVKDVSIPARHGDETSKLSLPRVAATFPLLISKRFVSGLLQVR